MLLTDCLLFFLKVPKDFDFLSIMDLFFKVHKVFILNFNPKIVSFMTFLEVFFYDVKGVFVYPKTQELMNKLSSNLNESN